MLKKLYNFTTILLLIASFLLLSSCFVKPPRDTRNVCAIYHQYPNWYWDAKRSQSRWGIPMSVLMAIMYQESHFQPTVKPAREKLLWIIPWERPTTANGFSQATNETWWRYQDATHNFSARRSNFKDAIDFVGWYTYLAHIKLHIRRNDAYALYLAYHEGIGGYARGTYRRQRWLRDIAWRVQRQANIYHWQLTHCELPHGFWSWIKSKV